MAEFVNGLRVFKPRENAPEFIKANLVINVEELKAWLETNRTVTGGIRIDIKESKGGKWYAERNNYVSQKAEEPERQYDMREINPDDIPF